MALQRKKKTRTILNSVRKLDVADAVGKLRKNCELVGLTKGQWSLADLISHVVDQVGPCDCLLATWTVGLEEIAYASKMRGEGKLLSFRMVLDYSFASREPAYTAALRVAFGDGCFRVTSNHAKWIVLQNYRWNVVVRTSMNFNQNPRCEQFELSDDAELAGFFRGFAEELFANQRVEDVFGRTPGEHVAAFAKEWGPNEASARFFGDGPGVVDLRRVGRSSRS